MPSKRVWEFDGITVTSADVRRWMSSVGHRIPLRLHRDYIKHWNVPRKIADHKRRGIFEATIAQAADDANVKVRKARTPGTLARVRAAWPTAANDQGSIFSITSNSHPTPHATVNTAAITATTSTAF